MTLPKLIIRILLAVFIIVAMFSCRGSYIASLAKDTDVIPGNLAPQKQILLVEHIGKNGDPDKPRPGKTKKLKKVLKKYYHYRYEIASANDILNNPKYSDTSVYRFAIFNNISSATISGYSTPVYANNTAGPSRTSSVNVSSIDFYFYDRMQKKNYSYSGYATSFLKTTFSILMGAARKNLKKTK